MRLRRPEDCPQTAWHRAFWATLLPFILAFGVIVLATCLGSTIFAAIVKGG